MPIARQIQPIRWPTCSSNTAPTIANDANATTWIVISRLRAPFANASVSAARTSRTKSENPPRAATRERRRAAAATPGGSGDGGTEIVEGRGDVAADTLELVALVAVHEVDVE